jgi:catechol 2,3-dioxygenase-like lactoylglutathione lyase family enzyme
MQVRGLVWLGVRTPHFQETAHFYRDVLGLAPFQEDATSARFRLANRTEIHVYGPADQDHLFFGPGPVVGILVDDVDTARATMEAAGIEFIGPIQRDKDTSWNHFRGPDGNVYEIMSRTGDPPS